MRIRVLLFALARRLAGGDHLEIDLPSGSKVAQLRQAMTAKCPELAAVLPSASFAIDADYATDDALLSEHSEVALILPVSGG